MATWLICGISLANQARNDGQPTWLGSFVSLGLYYGAIVGDGNGVCDMRVLRSKLGNALRRDHGRDQFPKRGRNGAPPQMGSQIPLNQVF